MHEELASYVKESVCVVQGLLKDIDRLTLRGRFKLLKPSFSLMAMAFTAANGYAPPSLNSSTAISILMKLSNKNMSLRLQV